MTQVLKSPFLSNDDFKSACNALLQYIAAAAEKDYWATAAVEHENVCRERCRGLDIANIRKEEAMIVFTRRLRKSFSEVEEPVDSSDLIADICDEDDVEVVVKNPDKDAVAIAEYSIVLSSTYQVPVLYFALNSSATSMSSTINDVYSLLVEPSRRTEMNSVGVMGAISYAEHPHTARPAFFIHPCNTADALCNLAQSMPLTIEKYLQLWLGLVGPVVGLHLPLVDSRRLNT